MAKKKQVTAQIKVQITGGQATPAPPVGTALGPHGVNIGQFVQQFNERTRDMTGTVIPVIITVYNDRSFEFILKSPPAAVLLKQAAQVARGAANPRTEKVGTVTQAQVREIAQKKLEDMNTSNIEQAAKVVAGTARSMGITIVD
ncbi:50S ribosomal protein L11 [Planctomicrobium sp. SH527]|uniref:50S ribosomal protein L11 n=1 Tax=Planctomicrobium sp. SH527 TaxID=3448123 RepID=UPI003F5C7F28